MLSSLRQSSYVRANWRRLGHRSSNRWRPIGGERNRGPSRRRLVGQWDSRSGRRRLIGRRNGGSSRARLVGQQRGSRGPGIAASRGQCRGRRRGRVHDRLHLKVYAVWSLTMTLQGIPYAKKRTAEASSAAAHPPASQVEAIACHAAGLPAVAARQR